MKIENINKNLKIAILGYWKEWKSSLNFIKKIWIKNISILDKNEILDREEDINYIIWEKYLDNLDIFDLIIKSPWISVYNNKLDKFKEKIITNIDLFLGNYTWKVIWITGTKGKSTTSTILYKTLEKLWLKVKLVWNIWNPVLDEIDIFSKNKYDYVIFEMSSFMLCNTKLNLYIWYLNNLYDCHLDWHSWKKNYVNDKLNILRWAYNKIANIETKNFLKDFDDIIYFWEWTNFLYKEKQFFIWKKSILKDENFLLKWLHNRTNIIWIIAILKQIFKDNLKINKFEIFINWLRKVLETFSWLANRIENIWTYNWIIFVDDAIATTPESTIAAIKTFEQNIWTLILWWQDSGFKFDKLLNIIYKYKIKNIILFPDTWEKIFWDLSSYEYETNFKINLKDLEINILKTKNMGNAIKFAYKNTQKWKICLLSTAAPSFSVWKWYLHKSEEFQKYIKLLKDKMI